MKRQTQIELRPTEYRNGRAVHFDVERHEQAQPMPWDDAAMIPAERVVRAVASVQGSYEDRARGFALATWQLSIVTGAGLVIGAAVLGNSLSFLALAGWFFAGFCAIWLVSFLAHTLISAEGSQFLETVFLWRLLAREQAERHRRMGAPDRTIAHRVFWGVVLALAILAGLAFMLIMLAAVVWGQMPQ